MDQDLNVKCKTIKLLEKAECLCDPEIEDF